MKLKQAKKLIEAGGQPLMLNVRRTRKRKHGFMVHFEHHVGGILHSMYFPDKHDRELLIADEEDAWRLAKQFACQTDDNYINVYVIDHTFSPVPDYYDRKFKKY